MQVGHKIRKIRELRNLTQEHMADRLGISQESYSRLENGQAKLDLKRMQDIATLLDVDPVTLLSFDENLVFNNSNAYIYGGSVTNYYTSLAATEKETLLRRIQELENEIKELKK